MSALRHRGGKLYKYLIHSNGRTRGKVRTIDEFFTSSNNIQDLQGKSGICTSYNIYKEDVKITPISPLIVLHEEKIIAARDNRGICPLIVGEDENHYVVSSESNVLDILNMKIVKDIEPGKVLIIDDKLHFELRKNIRPKFCVYEYLHFANPTSRLDGVLVEGARYELGKIIPETDVDMIVPIPECAKPYAIAYSEKTGIRYEDILVTTRYESLLERIKNKEMEIRLKISPVKYKVKNKKILLVDDVIRSGKTVGYTARTLKKYGAKKVEVGVISPLKANCLYGKHKKYGLIGGNSVKEMEKVLGVDSLFFPEINEIPRAIGISKEKLCMDCLTGEQS